MDGKKVFISTRQPHTQIFSTAKTLHFCSNNIKRLAVTQGSLYRAKKKKELEPLLDRQGAKGVQQFQTVVQLSDY